MFSFSRKPLPIRSNFSALCLSLLGIFLLYSLCRIAFYFFNQAYFPDMTVARFATISWGGFRFDLAALLYTNLLVILLLVVPFPFKFRQDYQQVVRWIFVLCNGAAFALNTIDFVYFRFTLRRTTARVFDQFQHEQNVVSLLFQFVLDYWYAVLFWFVLLYLIIRISRQLHFVRAIHHPLLQYSISLLGFVLACILFVGGVRGGFKHSTRPITISNAAAYIDKPIDVHLVLNTPFAFLRTANEEVIKKVNYFPTDAEAEKIFSPIHQFHPTERMKRENVVIFIMESFSREFFSVYNRERKPYTGYTPFLDSLVSVSLAFDNSFANGRKSIDGMPSVLASIPSIEVPFVLSHYSTNRVNSLASLLSKEGYYTAFFHGAPNGSMGFDAFAKASGFADYYGKSEYNNDDDYDGIWGIWDEPFLQFTAHKLNTFQQPFFVSLFTVSSHHPYKVPSAYKGKFSGEPVQQTISYTDHAFRKFFETAKKMKWYDNTLFVFTADHASAEVFVKEYNSAWGFFSIPVFFYKPNKNLGGVRHGLAQQIDIMPSVLDYLQYPKPFVAFGHSVFSHSEPIVFNYLNQHYQLFSATHLLQFNGQKSVALFDYHQDQNLTTNLLNKLPDTVARMETKVKAFIQQYNNRMVDDNLTLAPK